MTHETYPASAEDPMPTDVFLIIEGSHTIQITRTVTTIGRNLDNHVVLDDPRVSRRHLEIRLIRGNFVFFDLNSSGGTYINGQRISQGLLYSGDMLSLAGVNIVFMRGSRLPNRSTKDSDDRSANAPEHNTVVFRTSPFKKKEDEE